MLTTNISFCVWLWTPVAYLNCVSVLQVNPNSIFSFYYLLLCITSAFISFPKTKTLFHEVLLEIPV